jgi:hypothetical protein
MSVGVIATVFQAPRAEPAWTVATFQREAARKVHKRSLTPRASQRQQLIDNVETRLMHLPLLLVHSGQPYLFLL